MTTNSAPLEKSTEKFYFSYSSLQKLLNNPRQFYKEYILKEREDKDEKYFTDGRLFHLLLLEPEKFDEQFILSPTKIPGGYAKDIIDELLKKLAIDGHDVNGELIEGYTVNSLETYEDFLLDYMVGKNYYQSLKTDDQRIGKVCTPEGYSYYSILSEVLTKKKTLVSVDTVMKAKAKADAILENEECKNLLHALNAKEDVRKELELQYDIPNYPFGLKGVIDLVKIDYANETIIITDFKTTSKTLLEWYNDFEKSSYLYWLQVIIYKELILSLVPSGSKNLWKLKVKFAVIDKSDSVYVFNVSIDSLRAWETKTKEKFEIARFHYENELYDLPYELQVGTLEL